MNPAVSGLSTSTASDAVRGTWSGRCCVHPDCAGSFVGLCAGGLLLRREHLREGVLDVGLREGVRVAVHGDREGRVSDLQDSFPNVG